MNMNDLFPSKFLKAADLKGHEPVVTIARVELEPMGRTRELKGVVYFVGKAKGLKLNKTNATSIQQIAGSADTDRWTGRTVTLFATVADFGGQTYDVVRIKAPGKLSRPVQIAQRPTVPAVLVDELAIDLQDAEIPF
jgi:hypothetical protein